MFPLHSLSFPKGEKITSTTGSTCRGAAASQASLKAPSSQGWAGVLHRIRTSQCPAHSLSAQHEDMSFGLTPFPTGLVPAVEEVDLMCCTFILEPRCDCDQVFGI